MHKVTFILNCMEHEFYFRTRFNARRKFNKLLRDYSNFPFKIKHHKITKKGLKLIDCKVRG